MGGWKQKEEPSLLVPSTFLFLYQPSVCLCVSRVRAYLTTNQHFPPRFSSSLFEFPSLLLFWVYTSALLTPPSTTSKTSRTDNEPTAQLIRR